MFNEVSCFNVFVAIDVLFLLLLSKGLQSIEFSHGDLYQASVEEVPEDGVFDSNLLQVTCIDATGQPVPSVRYHVTGGSTGPFQVNSINGTIEVRRGETIDYEMGIDFYNFTVECYDMASRKNNDTLLVNITILPVNEYYPMINVSTMSVNVTETLKVGTTLFSTVPPSLYIFTAFDRDRGDHGRIRYSLSSERKNNSFFNLSSTTGALTLAQSLDIDSNLTLVSEDIAIVAAQVIVCDRDENIKECPTFVVIFLVHAINEFYPKFSQKTYYASVSESAGVGTNITEVVCTDGDKGIGSFQRIILEIEHLQTTNISTFALKENYVVTLAIPLDFEKECIHNITLTCYDNDGKRDKAFLLINVTAVNDHPPQFTNTYYNFTLNRFSKTGTEVGRVTAVDSDQEVGGDVKYSLSGESSHFDILPDGVICLKADVYIYQSDNFSLSVIASDGEYNDTAYVNISVVGFLNVTEIAILSTALAVLFIILFCCCICCVVNWKRLHKRNDKKKKAHKSGPAQEETALQIRPELTVQSIENRHYIQHPLHEVDTAIAGSESEESNEGGSAAGGEGGEQAVAQAEEREQRQDQKQREPRYHGIHEINRQTEGKRTEIPEERLTGIFKEESNKKAMKTS